MSLSDLLTEAIEEQENSIPFNRLSVYNRLLDFRNYLIDNLKGNSVSSNFSKIKTFYRYNRINIPFIPPINSKALVKYDVISFDDLLTKEEIIKAFEIADEPIKSWILVLASSGCSRLEAKSLTNEILYRGTYSDHRKDDFSDALKYLAGHDDVVCTCKLTRRKTDKPYYTFLNPETVQFIARTKLESGDFNPNNHLLDYSVDYVGRKFSFINDYLDLGYAGAYRRFRPHMLRKFNATYLNQVGDDLLDMEMIDCLHGRSKGTTREAYFKNNPYYLKLAYVRCMNNVSLFHTYTYEIADGKLRVYSKRH